MKKAEAKTIVTMSELAEILSRDRSTIWRRYRAGAIPGYESLDGRITFVLEEVLPYFMPRKTA